MILDVSQLPEPPQATLSDLDNIDESLFAAHQPLVMRGLASDWQLVKEARKSESGVIDFLSRHAGDDTQSLVRLDREHLGRMFYANHDLSGFNFRTENVSLADGLSIMKRAISDSTLPSACFQCIPVLKAFPYLAGDLRHPIIDDKAAGFVWMGTRFTVAPHFDEAQNIAIVATGKRRFTLFPPEQIHNLYVGPIENTPAGQPISLVDIRKPDLTAHPRYAIAYEHGMSVELEPGDAIYIPSPWWHHVESLSDFNMLVNYWWSHKKTSTELPFPALMHALQAFSEMKPQEKAAWRAFMDHFVFAEDDGKFRHIPDKARGVLGHEMEGKSVFIHNWLARQLR